MTTKIIKAAAYCRVSTLLGQTVDNQLVPIREICSARGFDLSSEREYCDEGISGVREKRPELDRLLRDAKAGKFKVLLVASLDRLGRNVRHLLTLMQELNAVGVKFISLRESIDLSTPQGEMVFVVLAAVAQLERELTRARIREALAARKLTAQQTGSGWRCGRPSNGSPEITARVLELHRQGLSVRKIAKALNKVISYGTVQRILKSEHRSS